MVKWTSTTPLSTKKFWLRRLRASFHLYRRLIVVIFFIVISSFLMLMSFSESPLAIGIRGSVLTLGGPIMNILRAPLDWGEKGKSFLSSWVLLHKHQEALQEENMSLREKISSLETLQEENNTLRHLLHVTVPTKDPRLTVPVLAYPARPYGKNLLLNAGEEAGVQLNQVALYEKGLVGRVLHVNKKYAHVLLMTDVNSHIPVRIKGTSLGGILVGDNGPTLSIKYMDSTAVKVGDIVETSGHGGIFPSHLPIGEVVKVAGDTIFVNAFCDLDHLSFVMLVNPVVPQVVEKLVDHVAAYPS